MLKASAYSLTPVPLAAFLARLFVVWVGGLLVVGIPLGECACDLVLAGLWVFAWV